MVRLIVDCFGGDHSPDANIQGSITALKKHDDLEVIFTGDESIIKSKLDEFGYDGTRTSVVHAPEVVTGEDKPTEAVRTKRESSMMKAFHLLREDKTIDGFVSIGATGCLVAGTVLRVGRVPGVIRPAFCPILPTMKGGIVGVCDSGANAEVRPEMLQQFAIMGSIYLKSVYGIDNPKVALLNIGTEEEKGDEVHKESHQLLKNTKEINFVGNMEGRDLLSGNYDLIVADGFSGNIMIKTCEGTAIEMLKMIKKDIYSKTIYKIGALFMKKMFKKEKDFMNYQNYGGSVMLGSERVVVKGHGSLKAEGFAVCMEQAYKICKEKMIEKLGVEIAKTLDVKE